MLSTVFLNVPNEIWEKLGKALSNSTKNPSIDKSKFGNFDGIYSLIYSRMPTLFAFLSNLYGIA